MSAATTPSREEVAQSKRSLSHTRHGHTVGKVYSSTYHSWQAMLARCRYTGRDHQNKHVNRGIAVCEEWRSFEQFLSDMGERPLGTTLDRYPNNDGDYGPGNCRWATPKEQARNTRRSKLTLETATQVAVARLRGEGCSSIAARFNISESLPREIVKGRTWPDALVLARSILEKQK